MKKVSIKKHGRILYKQYTWIESYKSSRNELKEKNGFKFV